MGRGRLKSGTKVREWKGGEKGVERSRRRKYRKDGLRDQNHASIDYHIQMVWYEIEKRQFCFWKYSFGH